MAIRMFVVLVLVLGLAAPCRANDFLHDNGFTWLNFGPAILTGAKGIVLINYDNHDQIQRITKTDKDKDFSLVKNWIVSKFVRRLNRSPQEPHDSVELTRCLILYSSNRVPKADRTENGTPLLFQRDMESPELQQKFLLAIPLTPSALGETASQFEIDYAHLKQLMGNHHNLR